MKEYLNDHTPNNASDLMETLTLACNLSMPKRNYTQRQHKPQYWWTQEIATMRKIVLAARRRYQRSVKRGPAEDEHQNFKEAKKSLRIAIRSQKNSWKQLCTEVDHDPWGSPYKIVMRKIGKRKPIPSNLVPNTSIVAELFPEHPKMEVRNNGSSTPVPPIKPQEFEHAGRRLRTRKAPGPDGIPNEILKIEIKQQSKMFLRTFNRYLEEGIFPKQWK